MQSQYYGELAVGTPEQTFTIRSLCVVGGRHAEGTESNFAVSYGTGEVRGTVGSDVVRLGALRLPRQGLGLAADTDGGFLSAACDGLLGLGLARLSKQRVQPPFQAALPQLDVPLFSLWLNPNTAPSAPAGALVLGGSQPGRRAGALAWQPVAPAALLDSGTSLLLASDADAAAINSLVPGLEYNAGMGVHILAAGCGAIGGLPSLVLALGGRDYTLTPDHYIIQLPGAHPHVCISSIVGGGSPDFLVLGCPFLRAHFSAFALDTGTSSQARVGLAPAVAAARR
ncbi:hypothetical protein WJX81_002992 [Elliptochloris bilobata]|uniref:Peptidase A1 domain-containing protein n=1 Tax=Elliptochloris bilobata TaxID=381761 RepID=A0AAW1QZF5_9CHLO